MRKTKIICTIGPSSQNEETLTAMCLAGMNVCRLNFSHGDHAEQQNKIDLIKRVREKLNMPIAIMLDTKGPEYRIGTFANEQVTPSPPMISRATKPGFPSTTRACSRICPWATAFWSTTAWWFLKWQRFREATPSAPSSPAAR